MPAHHLKWPAAPKAPSPQLRSPAGGPRVYTHTTNDSVVSRSRVSLRFPSFAPLSFFPFDISRFLMQQALLHDRIEDERPPAVLALQFLQPFFTSRPAGRESLRFSQQNIDAKRAGTVKLCLQATACSQSQLDHPSSA